MSWRLRLQQFSANGTLDNIPVRRGGRHRGKDREMIKVEKKQEEGEA